MKIIAHRGVWSTQTEKNSKVAILRAVELGFGFETDVRDAKGRLVISHDVPTDAPWLFDELLEDLVAIDSSQSLPIAINVKSDGLSSRFEKALDKYEKLDIFLFDMSIPDMKTYFRGPLNLFYRLSEVESPSSWSAKTSGIWLDSFESNWYDREVVDSYLDAGWRVCVVSPELHGRDPESVWSLLNEARHSALMLCTDYPELADQFFNGEKAVE